MSFPLLDRNALVACTDKLYLRTDQADTDFGYSDGVESEQYLKTVLTEATDLSSMSTQLQHKIVDWPSEYHLSPQRANLLRPFELDGIGKALEIGCGCGAITRYLGERGIEVDAVEGSRARARLAALRCRDLDNVHVVCANFNDLSVPEAAYDAVFLIGVTEYAARFCPGANSDRDAVIALLRAARAALRPGGVAVIAIENRVGLKYLFGAHEDHYAQRYVGIHDYPEPAGIRTYTEKEWQVIIDDTGFDARRFFFPFPDYKLPSVILSQDYLAGNCYAYCHLDGIRTEDKVGPLDIEYPEPLYWQAFNAADSIAAFANSFLILLSDSNVELDRRFDVDFAHLPNFVRQLGLSCIVRKHHGSDQVERIPVSTNAAASVRLEGLRHELASEPFHEGKLLSVEWSRSLLIHENTSAFEGLLGEYHRFLAAYPAPRPIDLLPCNIVLSRGGEYRVFDQEWWVDDEVSARFIFFRALIWFAVWHHPKAALRVLQRNRNIRSLGEFVRYAFASVGEDITGDLPKLVEREQWFQSQVNGDDETQSLDLDAPLVSEMPLQPTHPRVYWKNRGEEYAETRSVVKPALPSSARQSLVFDVPVPPQEVAFLRFDPFEWDDRPADAGFMHVYGIEVQLVSADCAAPVTTSSLRGENEIAQNTVQSGMRFHSTSFGSVFVINDDDPWMDFPFTPRLEPEPGQRLRVVIDMRLPRSQDYLLARDAYQVQEEAFERKRRELEEIDQEVDALREELATIKSSKVWRAAEYYRKLVYDSILPRFARLRRYAAVVRREGPLAAWRQGAASLARRRRLIRGLPVTPLEPPTAYEQWLSTRDFGCRDTAAGAGRAPLISIVMPVYNVDPEILDCAIDSVRKQSYANWELCVADDCSTNKATREALERLDDERIKLRFLERNLNIAGASNAAAELASGSYIALLDNDDELAPNALAEVVAALAHDDAAIVYSDEDFITPEGHLDLPHFKPDYSPDLLLSHNYITHFLVMRKTLFDEIGGFRPGYDGAQDYDLILRAVEQVPADEIAHIRKPLYHWRMSLQSTSLNPEVKPEAHENARRALKEALARRGIPADVENANLPHYFRVRRRIQGRPLVSIILPFKDKPGLLADCVDVVLAKSTYENYEIIGVSNDTVTPTTYDLMHELEQRDPRVRFHEHNVPFNFSRLINFGISRSRGEHIVLLNNDIEVITAEWLENLLEHSQRDDVAAVGGKLYYPNNTIQHAGIMIGLGGYAGHAHRQFPARSNGYFNRLKLVQNVSAVTGALMMYSRALHDKLGGFNEDDFAVAYNDVDFCLRGRYLGLLNVFTPYVEAYHHESISRGYEDTLVKQQRFRREMDNLVAIHGEALRRGDPYYNPNFDQGLDDFSLAQ